MRDRISGIFTKKKQGHVASKARADTRFAKRVCNAKGRVPNACPEDVDVAASPDLIDGRSCRLQKASRSAVSDLSGNCRNGYPVFLKFAASMDHCKRRVETKEIR